MPTANRSLTRSTHARNGHHLRNLTRIKRQYDASNDAGPVTWADYDLALALEQLAARVDALEQLTGPAALAAAACWSLLTGEPDPSTFDPADLEAAALALQGVSK